MHRILSLPFVKGLRPGFSAKKLVCDALLFLKAFRLVIKERYDVIHAVEESAFMALVMKWMFGIPYVYDMDSSLAQQMMEKHSWLAKVAMFLNACERTAIRQARAVLPVCQALGTIAKEGDQSDVLVLHDVPLEHVHGHHKELRLREKLKISGSMVMYVGNLESYQGIDLLIDSFAVVIAHTQPAHLVIVGGDQRDIERYQSKAKELGIQDFVHFLGPQPVEDLALYLAEADVLVSPRIKGNNTPMKVYSYLQSGVAVVATDLPTHTQVMDSDVAELVAPTPQAFAKGVLNVLSDQSRRDNLGKAAQCLVKEQYSYESFSRKINALYDWLNSGSSGPLRVDSVLSVPQQPTR